MCQGFSHNLVVLHHFVLAKLAMSATKGLNNIKDVFIGLHLNVNKYILLSHIFISEKGEKSNKSICGIHV